MKEPSTQFPFRELDTIEDRVREAVLCHGDLRALLCELLSEHKHANMTEGIKALFDFIRSNSTNATVSCCALMWATGAYYDGKTCRQWAMELGMDPQAFDQIATRLCRKIGIVQTRTLRGEIKRGK